MSCITIDIGFANTLPHFFKFQAAMDGLVFGLDRVAFPNLFFVLLFRSKCMRKGQSLQHRAATRGDDVIIPLHFNNFESVVPPVIDPSV
jgi:hypothetical protein